MDTPQSTTAIATSDLIAWVESRNDPWAFRFEPATYSASALLNPARAAILATITRIHNCSAQTARVIYSSSFGAFQDMGFNIYGGPNAYTKPFGAFLASPSDQLQFFNAFCQSRGLDMTAQQLADSEALREQFGTVYNGNGVAYAAQIAAACRALGLQVN